MLSQYCLYLLTITSLLKCTFYFDHIFNCSLHDSGHSMSASFFYTSKIFRENRTLFSKTFLLFPFKVSKTPRVHTDTNKWWNKLTKEGKILCRRIPNNLHRYSSYRGETNKHYISQMIQINIINHVDSTYPWQQVKKKNATLPLWSSSQYCQATSNSEASYINKISNQQSSKLPKSSNIRKSEKLSQVRGA